ncbi:MAG: hypothetical protein QXT20_03760 [Candidatus Woesearchaeota archaeon]
MDDLDKMIEDWDNFAKKYAQKYERSIKAEDIKNKLDPNLTKKECLEFLKEKYAELNKPFPEKFYYMTKNELEDEVIREIKEENVQKSFYVIFLTKYELGIGALNRDNESAEQKLSKFKKMKLSELKSYYDRISGGRISIKNVIKSINDCKKDGMTQLIAHFEERAKEQKSQYAQELLLHSKKVESGDVKWLLNRYSIQDLEQAINLLYNSTSLTDFDESEIAEAEESEEVSRDIILKREMLQNCIQPMLDDLPLTKEKAEQKAFYIEFLTSFFHINLPIFKIFLHLSMPLTLATQNKIIPSKYSIKRSLEFMPIEDLEYFYNLTTNFKSLVQQVESSLNPDL